MGGQEVIVGNPTSRGSLVITGCSLVVLGSVALLLIRAGVDEPGFFLLLFGGPLVGLAALAVSSRHDAEPSTVVLTVSMVYVAPLVWLTLFATTGDMGCGFVLMVWAGLAWVVVAGLGFLTWRT